VRECDWSAGHAVQSGREKETHNQDHVMACCFTIGPAGELSADVHS
jgi:hypothetical protein